MSGMRPNKVNVLLVDDQPDKLLAYEVILGELGENLVKASSAREALAVSAQERRRRRADRRLHAGARRLPAGGDDPRASALPQDGDHLHLGHPSHRCRPAARLRDGRGRLRAGAGRAGSAARQGEGVRRAVPQDARARATEFASSSATSPSAPPSSKPRTRGSRRASRAGAWRSPPARWARGTGTSAPTNGDGTKASIAFSASSRRTFKITAEQYPRAHSSRRLERAARRSRAAWRRARARSRPNFACCGRTAKSAGASAPRPRASTAPAKWCASQRRHHRRHRPQGSRGAAGPAGARGRSSRPQCACRHPIDHPADARQNRRRLRRRRSKAASRRWRARIRCCRDSRWHGADLAHAGRRGTGALPRRRQDQVQRARTFRCSRQPRRAWRWRCTSSPPMRPSTARCRRPPARSPSTGNCSGDALTLHWAESGGPASSSRRRAVSA